MSDLLSKDDEKARDVAREMGRIEEHDKQRELDLATEKARKDEQIMQRERDLASEKGRREEQDRQKERDAAAEKARKQGLEDERNREKKKGGWGGVKILIFLVVIALLLLVVGYLTLAVSVTTVTPGNSLPFTTVYGVSFPEGQTIAIGNVHVNVLSYQNELISDIDGDREKLVIGEDRVIKERRAVITTFGAVTLMDTFFQIDLKYKGDRDNRAYFDMSIHTSKQVPDVLLRHLLPAEIDARPI